LNQSRSFGSQPSIVSKNLSTDTGVVSTTVISTVPSWKSTATAKTKKDGVVTNTTNQTGSTVYGSPIPAWKKKLLEQQRLQQQQQQEKATQSIPKWKLKQLERMQQQQQQEHMTTATIASTTGATEKPSSDLSNNHSIPIVASPSDERHDNDIIAMEVDHVIATALSNVATTTVVNDETTANVVAVTQTKHDSSRKSSATTSITNKWSSTPPTQNIHIQSAKDAINSRPRLLLGASPDTNSFGTRGGTPQQPSDTKLVSSSKSSWINKTQPTNSNTRNETDMIVGAVPSDDTVSIPSPEKDDPAEQSGIGESTSLLSPRRRGDITVNTAVDHNNIDNNNNETTVGRTKQWESPRTARLEAMKANGNHTASNNSAFTRPGSVGKASPVVIPKSLPSQSIQSVKTTKKWQPPKKAEVTKSAFRTTVPDVASETSERIERPVPYEKGSPAPMHTEPTKKSSVAEMKAKLWGTGKSEKLVVAPVHKSIPVIRDAGDNQSDLTNHADPKDDSTNSFGSPIRTNANNERVISVTPPKPNHTTFKSVATTTDHSILPNYTRGRPDVCTPNGPLPPQRSAAMGGRIDHQQLPPRRNLDTLWMKSLEQTTSADDTVVAPSDTISDDTMIHPSNDARTEVDSTVHDSKVVYSESYIEGLQNDPGLSPPPPPPEKNSHHRSPSIGDFQVSTNPIVKETVVEDVSNELIVSSPPVSPRMSRPTDPISPTIRPAVMPKWDDFPPPKSGSISPTTSRRLLPPKLPPTSPVATEKKESQDRFSEMIDCPPLDQYEKWGNDADITGPKEFVDVVQAQPVSPRSKHDRPWTKDANTLTPSTWMKPKADPPIETISSTPNRQTRANPPSTSAGRVGEEKKSSEDVFFQAQSPSSLMRMAADSIHAVDYDKAVQGLQRPSSMDEDDESLLSAATPGSTIPAVLPPEFEKAMSDTEGQEHRVHVPVFGDPTSFGAAGGEVVAEPSVRVADRAKALASWNGGLGVSPSRPVDAEQEIAPTLSPIRREESESEVEGMSPRVTKRGFGLDDWKRTKSFDSKAELETSSDFWQPSNLDNQSQVDERDWSKCDPDVSGSNLSQSDSLNKETGSTLASIPVPTAHEPKRNTPPLLEKSKMDTDSRPKMTWKKKPLVPKPDGSSVPPRPTPKTGSVKARKLDIDTSKAPVSQLSIQSNNPIPSTTPDDNINSFDPFDPFEFSFNNGNDKVEFTEVTEFSDGTDFFSASDPFHIDPSSFAVVQEPKALTFTTATTTTTNTQPTLVAPPSNGDDDVDDDGMDADVEYEEEYLYESEYPPTLSGLNPPTSGSNLSQYEVWSYDADTSNLQDGAVEI
jgi:hypothetical protein